VVYHNYGNFSGINRFNSILVGIFIPLIDLIWAFICRFRLTINNYLGVEFDENRPVGYKSNNW
jgi:hypothetical protein